MFMGKAGAYPNEAPFRSKLSVNYGRKELYRIGPSSRVRLLPRKSPGPNVINLLKSVIYVIFRNKLECLSPGKLLRPGLTNTLAYYKNYGQKKSYNVEPAGDNIRKKKRTPRPSWTNCL